jgi:lysyl-tRNA synthetase class I
MLYEPEKTIDCLLEHYKNYIDPNKIIFAIMNTDQKKREKVVYYLEKMIKNSNCKEKNFHNLYLFFLSQISGNNKDFLEILINYLQECFENKNAHFDVDYALKVFSQFKIYSAQAFALGIMEKYDEAIKISLQNDLLDEAKIITKNIDDMKVKKRLWLEVIKYLSRFSCLL